MRFTPLLSLLFGAATALPAPQASSSCAVRVFSYLDETDSLTVPLANLYKQYDEHRKHAIQLRSRRLQLRMQQS